MYGWPFVLPGPLSIADEITGIVFLLLVSLIGVVVGLGLVVIAAEKFALAEAFRKHGSTPVDEVDHVTETRRETVVGEIEPLPNGTFDAPFTDDEVVYAWWELEHAEEEPGLTSRGARRRTSYTTVDDGEMGYPFVLVPTEDRWSGAEILVDAGRSRHDVNWMIDRHAEPDLTDESALSNDDALAEYLAAYREATTRYRTETADTLGPSFGSTDDAPPTLAEVRDDADDRYSMRQHLLKPGDEVFVYGTLEPAGSALVRSNPGFDGSERESGVSRTPRIESESPWIERATPDGPDAGEPDGDGVPPVDLDAFGGGTVLGPGRDRRMVVTDYANWRLAFQYVSGLFFGAFGLVLAIASTGVFFDTLYGVVGEGGLYGGYTTIVWGGFVVSVVVLVLYALLDGAIGWLSKYSGRSFWTR